MKNKYATVTDDYAVMDTNNVRYYFGYEHLYCPVCNNFFDYGENCGNEEEHECDYEWAFKCELKGVYSISRRVKDFKCGCDMGSVLLECIGALLSEQVK